MKAGVVYQVKDTIFWKQITTLFIKFNTYWMLFIKSKIQFFESKSQRATSLKNSCVCCLSSQRYNFLKANHNISWNHNRRYRVVYQVKDTIFWKQITTCSHSFQFCQALFIKSKIQFFESKSQPKVLSQDLRLCCLSSQRYNFLKANHNSTRNPPNEMGVVYQVKDTIFWKQITTQIHSL